MLAELSDITAFSSGWTLLATIGAAEIAGAGCGVAAKFFATEGAGCAGDVSATAAGCVAETAGSVGAGGGVLCFLARAGAIGCGLLYLAATVGAGDAGCGGADAVSTSTLEARATVGALGVAGAFATAGALATAGADAGVLPGWFT